MEFAKPVLYCERAEACVKLLKSRMNTGALPAGQVWPDVCTLKGSCLRELAVDMITAGFPCQDISTAGRQLGLRGSSTRNHLPMFRTCVR